MIKESYVSFETARMLKEAGFDCNCRKWYEQKDDKVLEWGADADCNWNIDKNDYSRPTQALAARWLREVHGIHVFSVYQYLPEKWSYVIQDMAYVNSEKGMKLNTDVFDSCEESLEAGLHEVIKLIKK